MAKLSGFEKFIIREGVKMYTDTLKQDIKKATEQGKVHLMSEEYVDMLVSEIESKLKLNTKK